MTPGEPPERRYRCTACGLQSLVPGYHAGAVWCPCGSPEPVRQVPDPGAARREEVITVSGVPVRLVTDPAVPAGQVLVSSGLDGLQVYGATDDVTAAVARQLLEGRPFDYGAAIAPLLGRVPPVSRDAARILGMVPPLINRHPAPAEPAEDGIPWSDPFEWRHGDDEW